MKALSAKTLVILALVSLVLTVLFTYLWASLTGTVSMISSAFVFFTAAAVSYTHLTLPTMRTV